jgi:hypothetical protein
VARVRCRNPSWLLILPLIAFAALAGAQVPITEPQLVVTPRARVLPASATNRPFLSAARALQPVDLPARGYSEVELAVSGQASIYDWSGATADAAIVARDTNIAYATRVLVRRPIDASKASGLVIVELLDPTSGADAAPLWGLSWEHFLRRGDVWVGVTVKPSALAALRKFDAVRYGSMSFAYRQPAECPSPPGSAADAESGLAWDVIAQVGALLRSSSKENPLWDMQPHRVIAAGYAQGGDYLTTYANVLHRWQRRGGDGPIFDGYLSAGASSAMPIQQCAAPLGDADPRRGALPRDVPFVRVATESDFNLAPSLRREDGDERGDIFRLYEIPGTGHNAPVDAGLPNVADARLVGGVQPAADLCREPRGGLPLGLALNAIWQQYDEALKTGAAMLRAPRIETFPDGSPRRDERGNTAGGWRLPQLDMPLARYSGSSTPRDASDAARRICAFTGSQQPFEAARLKQLYQNRNEYLRRLRQAIDQSVVERRLVKEDGEALKNPAVQSLPAF